MLFFRYPDGLEGVRWSDIFLLMKGRDVDNALKLIELILTLPPTSVRNEATFSAMKLVKTKRNMFVFALLFTNVFKVVCFSC